MAASYDLFEWVKIPWPVYHPSPSWALWSESAWSHGRDPFVFQDGGLFYQAPHGENAGEPRGERVRGVERRLHVAGQRTLLRAHELARFRIRAGHSGNNKWYFFYTEETVDGTSYMESDALLSGWKPATAVVIDYGHAAEINQFDTGKDIFSRHSIHQYNDGTGQHVIRLDTGRAAARKETWACWSS